MRFESEELDKEILDSLMSHGIFISKDAPPLNKEKALVLLGEAMLERFIKEFTSLWRNELFPNCLLRDYEASEREVYETIHPQKPWNERKVEDNKPRPSASCSNVCKEVDEKMDQSIQAKLDKYLDLFEELKKKTKDQTAALTLLQEVSKDSRMEEIREEREANKSELATAKQINFMKKLGMGIPEGVTKREALTLIDEELGRNGE